MKLNTQELREFLDEKTEQYNRPDFVPLDPISIPHRFTAKEDIELIAFLMATIAWGKRQNIINSGNTLLELMDHAPHQFISQFQPGDLKRFEKFVYRTFQPYDVRFFLTRLQFIVKEKGTLENAFTGDSAFESIRNFRTLFLDCAHETRVQKHLPNVEKGAAAKRLNMYLRWMVRKDRKGVDFGIWNVLSPAQLCLPLDVHTARVSRKLGLLSRNANDWKAVEEVTSRLRQLDPIDPVKYDFALFSLGAIEQF